MVWLRQILAPPVFEDAEKTRLARLTYLLPISMFVPVLLTTIAVGFLSATPVPSLAFLTGILAFLFIVVLLVRLGYVRLASRLLMPAMWGLIATAFIFAGGVLPPFSAFFLIVLAAGLIHGGRAGFYYLILSAMIGAIVVIGESYSFLPPTLITFTAAEIWVLYTLYAMGAAVLVAVGNDALTRALKQAEHNARAFQRSEEKFRKVVESSPGHVFLLDRQGRALVMESANSPRVVNALKTASLYDGLYEPDRSVFKKEVENCFTKGEVRQFEIRGIDQAFRYQAWLSPVKRSDSTVDYLVCNMYAHSPAT